MIETNVLEAVQILISQQENRDKEEEKRRKYDREITNGLVAHMINVKNELENHSKETKAELKETKNICAELADTAIKSHNETREALSTFRNNARLFQSDENKVYIQAENRAKKLAKEINYNQFNENYVDLYVAIRRKIFKLISSNYQVNSYKNLTQNQLESVFDFINTVDLSDLRWSKKQQKQFDL